MELKKIYLLLLLLVNLNGYSTTKIIGVAEKFSGENISLYQYNEHLLNTSTEVAKTSVGEKGKFNFELAVDNTAKYYLKIKNLKANLYLSDNQSYEIIFAAQKEMPKTFGRMVYADLIFQNLPKDDINYLITDFNYRFDDFFAKNYPHFISSIKGIKIPVELKQNDFVKKSPKKLIDHFRNDIDSIYKTSENEYFAIYRKYAIASLELSYALGKKEVFKRYIDNSPVLINHDEYMSFFNLFYDEYFTSYASRFSPDDLIQAINKDRTWSSLSALFVKDAHLTKNQIRELIAIKELMGAYYSKEYKQDGIIEILNLLGKKSKHQISINLTAFATEKLLRFEKGKEAIPINIDEDMNLASFKGKYVYIGFGAIWNKTFLAELDIVKNLQKKYNRQIDFWMILVGDNFEASEEFIKQNTNFKIRFSVIPKDHKAVLDYDLKALPAFYFINQEGNYAQSPALMPSEGIESIFYKIQYDAEPKPRFNINR